MRKDWEMKTMSEVFDVRDGTHDSPKYQDEGYPLITSKNLKNGLITFDKIKYISEEDYLNINKRSKVDIGDVLFAMIGTIGNPTLIVDEPNYAIKNVALFKVDDSQSSQYLKYYLESPYTIDKMLDDAKGSTQRFVGLGYLRKFPIPIPSIQEQKQIVTILDEAFTAIDQAKANIEKNIINAKELFQSKLNDIFSQKGEGWEEKKLIEICDVKDGTHDSPKYVDEKDGIPFVTQKNILENGISFENTKFISKYDHNHFYKRSNVAYNDILFAMIGANRGMACIVDDKRVFSIKNVGLIKSNENYRAKFILYFFKSPIAKKYVAENSSGSAQGFIGLTKLRAFTIPYTNIENQRRIELQIESLNDAINTSIFNYNLKLNSFEELKKSILQKAFAGELTSPERTPFSKDGHSPSLSIQKNKNPERV